MTTTKTAPATTIEEVTARLAALPEFSATVYAAIKGGLYGEAFFSDLTANKIAAKLSVKPVAVNAALGHLIGEGLIYTESAEVNGKWFDFIHSYEHDNFKR